MKMVKEYIVHRKARECVQHAAQNSQVAIFAVAAQVNAAGQAGTAEF
jgi:hypothetical protein